MTNKDNRVPKGGQLRDEAADWFAVMRGPEADARRAEFEAWLARGALHRSAYNKIAETFSIGKGLKPPVLQEAEEAKPPPKSQKKRNRLLLVAVVTTAAVGTGLLTLSDNRGSSGDSDAIRPQAIGPTDTSLQLSTRRGEIRTFALQDSSSVTLDTDSLLAIAFTGQERGLRLIRGRGRFTVAHSQRPFIVRAGRGSVIAHGTIFDVRLTPDDEVQVHLLRGAIDVEMPSISQVGRSLTRAKHLVPGEQITFGAASLQEQRAPAVTADGDSTWPENVRDFDHIRLADLVSEANRYATTPIVLSSADLGELRVSGTFRLRDTRKLADNLALMLRLGVTATADNITLSRPCGPATEKKCQPPS